jgi:uncharacterized protein YdaU (DUF1376 family)
MTGDSWYKRNPFKFLGGVQGMGPELIGAYTVILDLIYAREGDLPRDDRHLSGVLGCSVRKARALTEDLLELGKIKMRDGKITNDVADELLLERQKQRETGAKLARNQRENGPTLSKNNGLVSQIREDKNNTPLTPQGGRSSFSKKSGMPEGVISILNARAQR